MTALLGGLLAVAVPPARANTSCPAGGPTITLHHTNGTTSTITAAEICVNADTGNRGTSAQYFTRSLPGATPEPEPLVSDGWSISGLLTAEAPGETAGFTVVPHDNGDWSTLTNQQLSNPSSFAGGLMPVVYVNGSIIEYFRPLRSDPSDVNAADAVQTQPDGTLDLYLHKGNLLQVNVTLSSSTVAPGQALTASVTAPGAAASAQPLSVSWAFGDGTSGAGASVSHAYPASGTYAVTATVIGADDSGGQSPPVAITVGRAAASARPSASGKATRKPQRSTTPATEKAAPPTPGPAAASPRRALPSSVVGTAGAATSAASASASTATPTPTPPAATMPSLTVVSGLLVGGGSASPASSILSSGGDTELAASNGGASPAGFAVGGLAGAALLGLGAAGELRWRRR